MTLPSITARQGPRCLYRAQSVAELMAALLPYCSSQSALWCLLWPVSPARQFMYWKQNREAVEEKVAEQVAKIRLPSHSQPVVMGGSAEFDADQVVKLLASQFPFVADSRSLAVVWSGSKPIALVGIAGKVGPTYGKMLILEAVTALENLAEVEGLRQELAMYRSMNGRNETPILFATEDGQIKGGTTQGRNVLSFAHYGRLAGPLKTSELTMPEEIVSGVHAGGRVSLNGFLISGRSFGAAELVEELTVYEFSEVTSSETKGPDEVAKKLTPTQMDVLRLLARGLHYKEIALRLGNSVHTIHHHVSAILSRLGCKDKLELIAKFKGKGNVASPPGKLATPPALPAVESMKDLPRPGKPRDQSSREERRPRAGDRRN